MLWDQKCIIRLNLWVLWECLKGYFEHIEYSPWDWNQTGIKLETKYVIYRKLANVCRKKISMLTGLKVLSWACQRVFFKPEHNAKGN